MSKIARGGAVSEPIEGMEELADALRSVNPLHDLELDSVRALRSALGEWRRVREEMQLTQKDVAARMRTTQSVVSELEAGTSDPRVSTLRRYLAALGESLRLTTAQAHQVWLDSFYVRLTAGRERSTIEVPGMAATNEREIRQVEFRAGSQAFESSDQRSWRRFEIHPDVESTTKALNA